MDSPANEKTDERALTMKSALAFAVVIIAGAFFISFLVMEKMPEDRLLKHVLITLAIASVAAGGYLFVKLNAELNRMRETGDTLKTEFGRVASEVGQQAQRIDEYKRFIQIDTLTLFNNRAAFDKKMIEEFDRCRRYDRQSSIILLDIDGFKKVNDTYGHPAGDKILRDIAKVIQKVVRLSDFLARYGGEEFTIILPETDLATAVIVAEKVRRALESTNFLANDNKVKVTASLGVARVNDKKDIEEVMSLVDKAMYLSKSKGRNRTMTEEDLK